MKIIQPAWALKTSCLTDLVCLTVPLQAEVFYTVPFRLAICESVTLSLKPLELGDHLLSFTLARVFSKSD